MRVLVADRFAAGCLIATSAIALVGVGPAGKYK
jgi:hypothetical protein